MAEDRKLIPQSLRFDVFRRDDFTCRYCGRSSPSVTLHADHVHPVAAGGTDAIDNFVTSCSDCNFGKNAKTGVKPQPHKNKAEPKMHPLTDTYGHTLTEDGEYRYKFKILGPIDSSQTVFAVCFYSYNDDRDTTIGFLELADLISPTKCLLYASHREWRFRDRNVHYGRKLRHKCAKGEEVFYKPGTGRAYKSSGEMDERVQRDDEQKADALRYGRPIYWD